MLGMRATRGPFKPASTTTFAGQGRPIRAFSVGGPTWGVGLRGTGDRRTVASRGVGNWGRAARAAT